LIHLAIAQAHVRCFRMAGSLSEVTLHRYELKQRLWPKRTHLWRRHRLTLSRPQRSVALARVRFSISDGFAAGNSQSAIPGVCHERSLKNLFHCGHSQEAQEYCRETLTALKVKLNYRSIRQQSARRRPTSWHYTQITHKTSFFDTRIGSKGSN